jgi:dTDP-4-dehydrorhamnose reductase
MKVLVTGASGQLGRSLVHTAPSNVTIDACTHAQLDLTNKSQVISYVLESNPSVVINAAAYTAVDRAETDRDQAYKINALAVETLAHACTEIGACLIQVSTDYVFDGQSTTAYQSNSPTNPINIYGASKLAGEAALNQVKNLNSCIVRTSWVYSPWGSNFVLTMLRLFRERGGASVVADQIGAPTSALNLARYIWQCAAKQTRGIHHYTETGVASWYDFAVAINEEALAIGLLTKPATVKAITTAEYPTPAKRPAFSLLDTRSSIAEVGFEPIHWRVALREVLSVLRNQSL